MSNDKIPEKPEMSTGPIGGGLKRRDLIFAAVQGSVCGTFATCRCARNVVAIRGKADVARTINFGSD
jgi:hypothetical protein